MSSVETSLSEGATDRIKVVASFLPEKGERSWDLDVWRLDWKNRSSKGIGYGKPKEGGI